MYAKGQGILKFNFLSMNLKRKFISLLLCIAFLCPGLFLHGQQPLSLQQLLNAMQGNYELLKREGSLVQANQAAVKATKYNRLPRLNLMLQGTVNSVNNVAGPYQGYGIIPSGGSGVRAESDLNAASGGSAAAGLNWEATNFGKFKAQENLAKSDLQVQMNTLASTQYDLEKYASGWYVELIHQYQLQAVQLDNVNRLQQLKNTIGALCKNGLRPGIDSSVAAAALSKSLIGLYEIQKNIAQTRVQLSNLTGLAVNQLNPDTGAVERINTNGVDFVFGAAIDTVHHPYINLYSSIYDQSKARFKLEKNSYFPKLFVDADAWGRGSSLSNADVYNADLLQGYEVNRFNYLVGLTLSYDIFNIAHQKLNSAIYRFQSDAALHQLQNEKNNLSTEAQQAQLEKDFQFNRLIETKHQLDEASEAYNQQLSLYNNGLSSIIDLNTAQDYYLQAQKDFIDAKVGLMKSVIDYSLVTNSFTALVQTLKL